MSRNQKKQTRKKQSEANQAKPSQAEPQQLTNPKQAKAAANPKKPTSQSEASNHINQPTTSKKSGEELH